MSKRPWLTRDQTGKQGAEGAAILAEARRRYVRGDLAVRMEAYKRIDPVTDCWIWEGGLTSAGYGGITIERKARTVHRLMLEMVLGRKLDRWEYACHRCDNRACFNPDHLFLGSPKANIRDANWKGRLWEPLKAKARTMT